MNITPFEDRVRVAAALVDGVSIRAVARMTDIHRDTIRRFGVEAGEACTRLHDALVRDVQPTFIEADELWTFVHSKQGHLQPGDPPEYGDQYVFVGLDATTKLIISYAIGKRNGVTTDRFVADLRQRVLGRPQISTDAFAPYPDAVMRHFADVDFATIAKDYAAPVEAEASRRYSPGRIRNVTKRVVCGAPRQDKISTSYIERTNLSFRMHLRRFTRLTNGFSKKLRNLEAAVGLFVAWYNFCRVHETLRVTPAMESGLTDHVWTLAELLDTALYHCPTPPPAVPVELRGMSASEAKGGQRAVQPKRLTLIRGGRSSMRGVA